MTWASCSVRAVSAPCTKPGSIRPKKGGTTALVIAKPNTTTCCVAYTRSGILATDFLPEAQRLTKLPPFFWVAFLLEGVPYVFPARGYAGPFNGFSKATCKLKRDLVYIDPKMETNFTLHDIRRSFATGMRCLGISLEVTEALLWHTSGTRGGIVSIYQLYDFLPEKRAALLRWQSFLDNLTAPVAKP